MDSHTHLSKELLRLFALGELSGTAVQSLANSAWKHGWGRKCRLARSLAKAGVWGKTSGNILRDIMMATILHGVMSTTAKPYKLKLQDDAEVDMFLPHEIYTALAKDDTSPWCLPSDILAGDTSGKVMHEWSTHPDVNFTGDLGTVGALGFHCDGVQYTSSMRAGGAKSVVIASLNVVSAAEERNRQRRFPLFVLRKARLCNCGCGGYCTYQLISQVISWSCRCLLEGEAPLLRHDSSPLSTYDQAVRLPPGSALPTAALLQVRGDWEGLTQFFRLRSYSSNVFCWLCDATLDPGPLCYKQFAPDAPYRDTMITHEAYMQSCADDGMQPSHMFRCPGFSLALVIVDSMHAADLGSFCDALGSLFFLEIRNKDWYGNQTIGLAGLNSQLATYYKANPGLSKAGPLVISQIIGKNPGHLFLKANAAQVRHLAEFGLVLANKYLGYSDDARAKFRFNRKHRLFPRLQEHLENLVATFQGMTRYVRSLSATPFDPDACREGMFLYLSSMGKLHELWRPDILGKAQNSKQPFNVRPKAHKLQHLVQDQVQIFGNPSTFWCYRDEDYVGNVKRICAKTKDPRTLESRVLQKLKILEGLGCRV